MAHSYASVPTSSAEKYVTQLGKHWAHKYPVRHVDGRVEIDLPFGMCRLRADAGAIAVELDGIEDADMDRFRTVVANHLQRFGHRETLVFDWRDGPSA